MTRSRAFRTFLLLGFFIGTATSGGQAQELADKLLHRADIDATNRFFQEDLSDLNNLQIKLNENPAWINTAQPGTGRTPLHHVIVFGRGPSQSLSNLISLLLRNGADPNLIDAQGQTPLTLAVARLKVRSVDPRPLAKDSLTLTAIEALLKGPLHGPLPANINARDGAGHRALVLLCQLISRGEVLATSAKTALVLLLQGGAAPNFRDDTGQTALTQLLIMAVLPAPQLSVASPTYLQILRSAAISLLEGKSANKADPNIPNLDGWTPLQLACQRLSLDGASQLVEDLIANGARPPQEKGGLTGELPTPLEFALAAGNRDLAQKLFNVGDRPFFTSWSKALTSEQLVSFTAPELAQRDRFGLTLLHVAALLDKPALVESILSYAALPSYVKAITLGSETPFQATDPDWLGQSALTYALRARTGHIEEAPEVVQALLSARLLPTRADVALVIANSDARVAHLLRDLVLPPSGTPSRHPRGYPLFDSLADRARFAELASPAV